MRPTSLLTLIPVLIFTLPCRAQPDPAARPTAILFEQYETVASMKSELIPRSDQEEPKDEFTQSARLPLLELMIALHGAAPNSLDDLKKNYPTLLLGAKQTDLYLHGKDDPFGIVLPHQAYIAVANTNQAPSMEADLTNIPSEIIDGTKVWTLGLVDDQHPEWEHFYAAEVQRRFFVVVLGKQDMRRMLQALTSPIEPASPSAIFAWDIFHQYDFWIWRSLHNRGAAEKAMLPETATADIDTLVLYANPGKFSGFLRGLSVHRQAAQAPAGFNPRYLAPPLALGGGVWQSTVPLIPEEKNRDVFAYLFAQFGFLLVL